VCVCVCVSACLRMCMPPVATECVCVCVCVCVRMCVCLCVSDRALASAHARVCLGCHGLSYVRLREGSVAAVARVHCEYSEYPCEYRECRFP
jgi:hypothetical protein